MFPIVFIYPEFGHFDYVERMDGEESLWGAFYEIFDSGLPWDTNKFYLDKKDIVVMIQVGIFNESSTLSRLSAAYQKIGQQVNPWSRLTKRCRL